MDATRSFTAGRHERRAVARPLDVKAEGFGGLAAVYYDGTPATEAMIAPDIVERFMPGCFRNWYSSGAECFSFYDHDDEILLGKRSNQLQISENEAGLSYFVPFDGEDPDHQRVRAKILRGDVRGSSIIFVAKPNGQQFIQDGSRYVRLLTDVDVYEMGPTPMPVYEATSAEARSGLYLPIEEIRRMAQADEALIQQMELESTLLLL